MRIVILFVSLLLGQSWASPSAPTDTTIAAVLADPDAFHGKSIRIRGEVDMCFGGSCSICIPGTPSGSRRNQCLATGFSDKEVGFPISDLLYRFAEIGAVGEFDATCLTGKDYKLPPAERRASNMICLDNGTTFLVERVEWVFARKPATEGRFNSPIASPLLTGAAPAVAAAIERAYIETWPSEATHGKSLSELMASMGSHVVLQYSVPGPHGYSGTELCMCSDKSCDGRWPKVPEHLILSPNNPYFCLYVENVNGKWRIPHGEPFVPFYASAGLFPVYGSQ